MDPTLLNSVNTATGYNANLGYDPTTGTQGQMYTQPAPASPGFTAGYNPLAPPTQIDPATAAANAAAAQQAALMSQLTSQAQDKTGQLNNIYNQLYGNIDQAVGGQRSNLEKGYNNQLGGLDLQYQATAPALLSYWMGTGAGDSSWAYNSQKLANDTYQNNHQSILDNENNDLVKLGSFGDQQKAQYKAQQDYINNTPLSNFANNSYGLSNWVNSLGQSLVNAQTALGGFGSNSQFTNDLNAIAPSQNQGANQLQKQLSDLTGSSLPGGVKDQLASGAISSNVGQDPTQSNYWLNYWKNLNPNSSSGITSNVI